MRRLLTITYAVVCYLVFFVTFLYAVGFVVGFGVPTTLDGPASGPPGSALLVDAGLLAVFALQHSIMARRGFKAWWTRLVPHQAERSTYVLFASVALALLFWQWRPIGGVLWDLGGAARVVLIGLSLVGWTLVFLSTWLVSHWDLFGLRQAWLYVRGKPITGLEFNTRGFYRYARHPIYLGFTIAFWATPLMTVGHLVFAVGTLAYMLVAIQLEEQDLVHIHGDLYRAYRKRVSMLLPIPRNAAPSPEPVSPER